MRVSTEAHANVQPRFNERFILSLASCAECLVLDDELNVLPISTHCRSIKPVADPNAAADEDTRAAVIGRFALAAASGADHGRQHGDARLARAARAQGLLRDTQPVGSIVSKVATIDQAKAVSRLWKLRPSTTVALTAGRGRGKSAR